MGRSNPGKVPHNVNIFGIYLNDFLNDLFLKESDYSYTFDSLNIKVRKIVLQRTGKHQGWVKIYCFLQYFELFL